MKMETHLSNEFYVNLEKKLSEESIYKFIVYAPSIEAAEWLTVVNHICMPQSDKSLHNLNRIRKPYILN